MFAATPPLLRRRGAGHVVKYLEGVPTPTKLIDHLAGADLHASAELPFFTTVPRYIDPQREQRLSRLFFHHVLYPAGGARLPYQAVVVRHARAVRTSGAAAAAAAAAAVASTAPCVSPRDGGAQTAAASATPRSDPLAVPAAHVAGSPLRAPDTSATSPAAWARVDPARRPYFAATPSRSGGLQSRPSSRHPHPPSTAADTAPASRAVEDSVLAPLRGVLELYFNAQSTGPAGAAAPPPQRVADRVRSLLVSPASGLLWLGPGTPAGEDPSIVRDTDASRRTNWDDVLTRVQRRAARGTAPAPAGATHAVQYVLTRLPPTATVALPLPRGEGEARRVLGRLAGGLEPVVPFAVGRPLACSTTATTSGAPLSSSLSERLFPHLSCLARLHLRVPVTSASTPSAPPAAQPSTAAGPASPAVGEPWRLGGPGLDLATPVLARTAAEPLPESPGGRYVVGRQDAETYLLPQRELLLTLHVPTRTEEMCAAQNAERLRRQVRAGHAAAPAAQAWPTDQLRLTSARRAVGQFANAAAANATGTSLGAAALAAAPAPAASPLGTPLPQLTSGTSYEVRALPGDVVFIPRGWGVDVRRILGTAALHQSHDSGGAADGDRERAPRVELWHHRTATSPRGMMPTPPSPARAPRHEHQQHAAPSEAASPTEVVVESVEVDALCLHYRPYPELTEAQAAVYVAANYVHGGVDAFYEEGGNKVHHVYE